MAVSQIDLFLGGLSPKDRKAFFRLTSVSSDNIKPISEFISHHIGAESGLDPNVILSQADIFFAEPEQRQESPELEKEKGDSGYYGEGTLRDHHRHEKDILDTLGQQQQENAIKEFDDIRNSNLSDVEKNAALKDKFRQILEKNQDLDSALKEQTDLLTNNLKAPETNAPLREGQISASLRIEQRTRSLSEQRAKDRETLTKLKEEEIVKRHILETKEKNDPTHLTAEEQSQLKDLQAKLGKTDKYSLEQRQKITRYNDLHYRDLHEKRAKIQEQHLIKWAERFAKIANTTTKDGKPLSPGEIKSRQDELLRKLLTRAQDRSRSEMWEVFDKADAPKPKWYKRAFFNRDQSKKTLTVKERRLLLQHQRRQLTRLSGKGFFKIFRFIRYNPPFQTSYVQPEQDDDNNSGGSSLADNVQQAQKLVKNAQNVIDKAQKLAKLFNGAGGTTGAAGGTAPAWPWILLVILVLVLIILFIILMEQTPTETVSIQCQNHLYEEANGFATDLTGDLLQSYFGIHLGPHLLSDSQENKDLDKNIFLDTCIMFGYQEGTLLTKGPLNTFGTLTIGDLKQRSMNPGDPPTTNGSKSVALLVYIDSATDNSQTCSMVKKDQLYDWSHSNGRITWTLMNPSLCSNNRLKFLLAQTYAYTLLEQQRFLAKIKEKSTDMLTSFKTQPTAGPGVINIDSKLPTTTCQIGNANVQNLGDPDSQQVNCFVDMIGTYTTYMSYFDAASSSASLLVPTPTGVVPPAGADPTTFGSFKTSYPNYYAFANKLFDGVDFFNQPTPPTGVVSCNHPLMTVDVGQTKDLIYKQYGFRVSVDAGLDQEDQLAQTYNTLCLLFESPTFAKLLQTMNPDGTVANAMTLLIHNQSQKNFQSHCGTGNDFNSNQPEIYACANPMANRFVLVHELGHTIYARNDALAASYSNLFEADHRQRFLPTDNCQLSGTSGFGSNPNHECFADMVAEYVVFNTYKHSVTNRHPEVTFSEFPTDSNYKSWYDWAGTYIFGGTSYANQSSNAIVEYAKSLKDQIVQACPPTHTDHAWEVGGYVFVNGKNKNCLYNMSGSVLGPHKQNVLNELFQSISAFYYLQCVGFARAVAQGVGAPIGPSDRASNQYYNWIPVIRGQNTYNVPGGVLPGDIALFSLHEGKGRNQIITPHIGIVVDVGPTGFDLAEANGGNGTVDITKGYNYHYDSNFDGVLRLKQTLP